MAEFTWEGRARTGEVRKGTMEADTADAVHNRLRAQQFSNVKVKKKAKALKLSFGSPVSNKELVIFTRQFSTMIDAGLPLVQCLDILSTQGDNKAFNDILKDVKGHVEQGGTFSDALARHPKVFDDLYVNLVDAGEVGGILDTILNRLAIYIEKRVKLQRQVRGAMVYPLGVLMVAIAAIKLESRGPAFYVQRRRGLNRNVIDVLKLRTLTVTESDSEVRQVTSNDARLTKTGRFLRRMSIDELPQLWNVLRGDMSVVGPRPHALVHDDTYATMLEEYANRHQVKPGITGLAQVNGLRGQTETVDKMKARVDQDIAYIKDWSLWLDIKIIARTAVIVALGKNAH